MKLPFLALAAIALIPTRVPAQQRKNYAPSIEPCACPVKADSNFKSRCGYLIVPENREKNNAKTIKLPFIIVESNNPNKRKDPVLQTSGGPGNSSLGWVRGLHAHSILDDRDCIAFEQRGTHYAVPNLWSNELSDAIKESYRKNLNKDSMVLEGTNVFKKSLEAKGIDLSGYNTDETVADIDDLLIALKIDSINLVGGSYSGGLMIAVMQKDPSRVRSLILNSPLPTFVPVDEDEPANFNEAITALSDHCRSDSADQALYSDLKGEFRQYFSSIEGKTFSIPYIEKGATDTENIQYTSVDLLDIIENALFDQPHLKDVPFIITEMIKGNHQQYIKDRLDGIFQSGDGPSGMRISVYCADQADYHSEEVLHQLYEIYPYMLGYHINDVYKPLCDCWQVPPIKRETRRPTYSNTPALIADGDMDPACRPLYMDMIHHYMPNSQRMLFINRSHGVSGVEWHDSIMQFLNNPWLRLQSGNKNIIVY